MNMNKIRLVAFDLDGTLTQHRTPMNQENRAVLTELSKKYKLLMVGAGKCDRIFEQMGRFPIDVLGNYGMQYAEYQSDGSLKLIQDVSLPCDRDSVIMRTAQLRKQYGFDEFKGDSVEFHPSGCVTIPLLGTRADIADKLAFDPDRRRRRAIYDDVRKLFSDFIVFIGGSSSFDMTPAPYDKAYALSEYCQAHGIAHDEVVYAGDDYGAGGNDEPIYRSDFNFIEIDDYRTLCERMKPLL